MAHNDLVDVLVALTCLPDQVIDRFASQQAFKALEVGLIKFSRLEPYAPNVAVVAASLALEHLLRLGLLAIPVRLLAHLAEGLLVVILTAFVAEREILRELKVV